MNTERRSVDSSGKDVYTGGIDFTANKTPLKIKNAGEGIKFPH